MAARIRRCASLKELDRLIDEFVMTGYKIKSRGESGAVVIKKTKKNHLMVALLTIWWTCGLGNLIYALIPAKVEDEVFLKIEEE